MKSGKLRLAWTVGLLGAATATSVVAWARPDPDPAPPPGLVQPSEPLKGQVAQAPGMTPGANESLPAEPPLRRTTLPDVLPPVLDAIILFALVGWLWMMVRRRKREDSLGGVSGGERLPLERGTLRTVTVPTDTHAESLRRYRPQWIEEFKSLQNAWAQHDLRPVSGIIAPEIRNELELTPAADDATLPQVLIQQADPADSWQENGNEFVTVHFAGKLKEPGAKTASDFDEYWTFFRRLSSLETGTGSVTGIAADDAPWVVSSIRRGNRERSLPRLAHRG